MDTLHIYNKLLQFALFQGLSKADLGALVTHTRLGFHKYAEGDTIARAQTTCDRLFFLIDGRASPLPTTGPMRWQRPLRLRSCSSPKRCLA